MPTITRWMKCPNDPGRFADFLDRFIGRRWRSKPEWVCMSAKLIGGPNNNLERSNIIAMTYQRVPNHEWYPIEG